MPLMFRGRTYYTETEAAALPDEYQDGVSVGSLVRARRCWLHLLADATLPFPLGFSFVYRSPTKRMAHGLMDFLRHTPYAGVVRTTDRVGVLDRSPWQVAGTAHITVWSLPSLEHLFLRLRGVGSRYESALVTLDLLPKSS